MDRNLELRKLPIGSLYNIENTLEIDNGWQKVMAFIPKDPLSDHFEQKYTIEHMRLIQEHAKETHRKCAEVLFDEWGTSGRIRPTIETLKQVLIKAEIFRAADEVATMLQEPLPPRPSGGPAAAIDINITSLLSGDSSEQTTGDGDLDSNETNKDFNHSKKKNLFDKTTKQVKSSTNLMKFSTICQSLKNKSFGRQTTAQMVTQEKDLIKFSSGIPTEELPALSALMSKQNDKSSNETYAEKATESTEVSGTSQAKSQSHQSWFPTNGPHMAPPPIDIYSVVDSKILEDTNLIRFEYSQLEVITNYFPESKSEGPSGPCGKIGKGGFGEVFVGSHPTHGLLAVKKVRCYLQFDCEPKVAIKVFNAEVKSLSQLRHDNIVPILGYSVDGPTPCIVCKYIEGGSLEQKLAQKVLTETERMGIMIGTAEGLKYIHNTIKPVIMDSAESQPTNLMKTYFIHGDVKSANILLTTDCVPKLCDFGLAKQLESTYIVSSMMGTSAYMPPEGFTGTITRKTDIFSFGIVILELLTGLRPIVTSSNGNINIKNYVEESCKDNEIDNLLDPVVDNWTKAQKVFTLAKRCLEMDRNLRPSMDEVCAMLNRINYHESYELFYARV
ncbi:hypothetical protein O3G_MSEX009801 [Manduca sexta]|uniref:Protein kinase domain-containing protein n=1 Tax=Manduca sexta TaxID=7130 RepID=A0A922CRA7_MANSE|nr:hypothetical protein O3G_MSEX009801 [Manduca sexta]KAG6456575.1 hypothetical protein O3G_MSEX009801 [Manduca sexta]